MSIPNETKLFWFGDLGIPSGFGRIGNAVTTRLAQRGWQLFGASVLWDGYPPSSLPFYVRPLGGRDIWQGAAQMIAEVQPDVIVCCQDMPYSVTMFHALRIDWSKHKFIIVTPIDGTPIHPQWLNTVDLADETMVISEFGVEAMRLAGKQVGLLHPGVDRNEFYPAEDGEITALRERMGWQNPRFVMGMFAMNQGRKCISSTVDAFREFALDKPDAILYLDMDRASGAGWDIDALCAEIDPARLVLRPTAPNGARVGNENIFYRDDAGRVGIAGLRERYLLCDVNSVVSHREGFGLPLLEGMACKVPAMALDWCSGSEICGGGKGALIRRIPYMEYGTWGGARDAFPDMADWVSKLNLLYRDGDKRLEIANRGYEWAITKTWDAATDQFEDTLRRVVSAQRKERTSEPVTDFVIPTHLNDTRAPGDGIDSRTNLQQPAIGDAMPRIASDNGGLVTDGNLSERRLFSPIQSDGAAPTPTDQDGAQPD